MAKQQITRLLCAHADGDEGAMQELLKLVYNELRRQASRRMAHRPPGQTLQPTALVHEAFVRLFQRDRVPVESRAHFFAAAGTAMRDILVEATRRRTALKRGGDRNRVDLNDAVLAIELPFDNLLAIDEALRELEREDDRAAQVVTLRFFVGLSEPEVADALNISERTVRRDWSFARAWLYQRLSDEQLAYTANA